MLGIAGLLLAVFSRCPDALLRARFWAEDGTVFYRDAHELGFLRSVFLPYSGYLHIFPRLIAGLSLSLPLVLVPLLFSITSLAVQCLPAVYLCTPRMRNIGPLRLRAMLAFLVVGNSMVTEVWSNLTNVQWNLALLSLLVLLSSAPQSRAGAGLDRIALSVAAVTGPFSIFLLPIAGLLAFLRRGTRSMAHLAILAFGALVQSSFLLRQGRPEFARQLGASFPLLCKLLVRGLLPIRLAEILRLPVSSWVFCCGLLLGALALVVWIFGKAGPEMRYSLLFTAIVLAASLASPLAASGGEQWPAMLNGASKRYWMIPTLMVSVASLWLAVQPFSTWLRLLGKAAMLVVLVACIAHWRLPYPQGVHFGTYVHVFNGLPVGQELTIPIDPPGWKLVLTRKTFDRMWFPTRPTEPGLIPRSDWMKDFVGTSPVESSDPLNGAVFRVNGRATAGLGGAMNPVHVSISRGALLQGCAVLSEHDQLSPMDQIYAIVSDQVATGDHLPFGCAYFGKSIAQATYLVFLPSTVLHPGLQEIRIVGYSRWESKLYWQPVYVYGE